MCRVGCALIQVDAFQLTNMRIAFFFHIGSALRRLETHVAGGREKRRLCLQSFITHGHPSSTFKLCPCFVCNDVYAAGQLVPDIDCAVHVQIPFGLPCTHNVSAGLFFDLAVGIFLVVSVRAGRRPIIVVISRLRGVHVHESTRTGLIRQESAFLDDSQHVAQVSQRPGSAVSAVDQHGGFFGAPTVVPQDPPRVP